MSKAEEFLTKLNALLKEYEAEFIAEDRASIVGLIVGDDWHDIEEINDGFSLVNPQITTTPELEPQGWYELQATCDGEHWFTLYRVNGDYPGCETYTIGEASGPWGSYQQCRVVYIPAKDTTTQT